MKKTILFAVALVVILGAFVAYSYFSPDLSIAVGKPADPNAESYVEQVQVAFSTKLGLPLPRQTKDRIQEFARANEAVILNLSQNYSKPIQITASVEISGGQTIVTYAGTAATPEGGAAEINERLVFDFVLTDKIA